MCGRPYVRGRSCEYLLATVFKRGGYVVVRGPASGRGSRTWYPDLTVISGGKVFFVEVKCFSSRRDIYIPHSRYRKLVWISEKASVKAYLCVKYGGNSEFRCVDYMRPSRSTEGYVVFSHRDIEAGSPPTQLKP